MIINATGPSTAAAPNLNSNWVVTDKDQHISIAGSGCCNGNVAIGYNALRTDVNLNTRVVIASKTFATIVDSGLLEKWFSEEEARMHDFLDRNRGIVRSKKFGF